MIALSRTDPEPDPPAKPMPYAYLGPEGTFTEAALLAFDPGAAGQALPTFPTVDQVIATYAGPPSAGA